jgi:hypothetical protein
VNCRGSTSQVTNPAPFSIESARNNCGRKVPFPAAAATMRTPASSSRVSTSTVTAERARSAKAKDAHAALRAVEISCSRPPTWPYRRCEKPPPTSCSGSQTSKSVVIIAPITCGIGAPDVHPSGARPSTSQPPSALVEGASGKPSPRLSLTCQIWW